MSCDDYDDMDVFVQLRKASANGTLLQNINIPLQDLQMKVEEVETVNSLKYLGPTGVLRASHRAVDERKSKVPNWPFHPHTQESRVPLGKVIKLEIGLWPTGIIFESGEKLVLKIAGHQMTLAEFVPLRGQFQANNKGRHHVHVGPEHPSHIIIPLVPM
jgi:predicted acyl esterase